MVSLSCSGHHRDLHSFPTRRSSDLITIRTMANPLRIRIPLEKTSRSPWLANCLGTKWSRARIDERRGKSATIRKPRSEEHTSELQSLRHLVCRLLLEKKNNDRYHTQ